jgi:hypothetical protein
VAGNPLLDLGHARKVIGVLIVTGIFFHARISGILLLKYYGFDFTGFSKKRQTSPEYGKGACRPGFFF